jgi:hypothetical protein
MAKMLKTSAMDRKCKFHNCTNILSIYNHEDYCHVHRNMMPQAQKTRVLVHSDAKTTIQ